MEEDGAVWHYNISQGLSEFRLAVEDFHLEFDEHQQIFRAPHEDHKTATLFAKGHSPKVNPPLLCLTDFRVVSAIRC